MSVVFDCIFEGGEEEKELSVDEEIMALETDSHGEESHKEEDLVSDLTQFKILKICRLCQTLEHSLWKYLYGFCSASFTKENNINAFLLLKNQLFCLRLGKKHK